MELDWAILNFIHYDMANPVFDVIMPVFSFLGFGIVGVGIGIVLLFFKQYRRQVLMLYLSIILALVIVYFILEPLIMRPRPFMLVEETLIVSAPSSWSMPSGHAAHSAAVATAVILINRRWWKYVVPFAVLVCFSRLYLFMHFPSDILAGAAIGIGCALLSKYMTDRFWILYDKRKSVIQNR